jgi:hypothetical protein
MKTPALATILALGLFAAPLATEAQQEGRVWRIGTLGWARAPHGDPLGEAFSNGLRELGYGEGKNFVFEADMPAPILAGARLLRRNSWPLAWMSSGSGAAIKRYLPQKA